MFAEFFRSGISERTLVRSSVGDGPTLTHGDAAYGAGMIAARSCGATVVDPRPSAVGSLARVFEIYPHIDDVVPAMGYSEKQVHELEQTVENADVDAVVSGTPHDLSRVIDTDVPVVRVRYELEEKNLTFGEVLDRHGDALGIDP
jgi:predicted GTPase